MKAGFLFDLDGVLIDSESEYTLIWDEIDRQFPTGVDNFSVKIKGETLPEILHQYFSIDDHPAVINMLNSMEQRMKYPLLPGADALLRKLQQQEIGAVLVTSSNEMKMKHLREEQPSLCSYFKEIVTADRISHSKPDPEGYLLGASLLEIDPHSCVVFEDSLQGVKAGKSAGAYVVGLSTTLPVETIAPYCNRVINNLDDVDLDELMQAIKLHKDASSI